MLIMLLLLLARVEAGIHIVFCFFRFCGINNIHQNWINKNNCIYYSYPKEWITNSMDLVPDSKLFGIDSAQWRIWLCFTSEREATQNKTQQVVPLGGVFPRQAASEHLILHSWVGLVSTKREGLLASTSTGTNSTNTSSTILLILSSSVTLNLFPLLKSNKIYIYIYIYI